MRARFPWIALMALLAAGCGGDDSGELLLADNLSFTVGGDMQDLQFGVAVPTTGSGAFTVFLSTRGVDCSTTEDSARGSYVTFDPTSVSPMVYDAAFITVVHSTGSDYYLDGASGHVEITAVTEASVAGSIAHATDGADGGIAVNGTFEVVRCF